MTKQHSTTAPGSVTSAHFRRGTWAVDSWTVDDDDGGTWWPSEEAMAEIAASARPAATALRIARNQPMRGTWSQ